MQEAAAVRDAARDAVNDVEPESLREHIDAYLQGGSMVPGVLTLYCARAVHRQRADGGTPDQRADQPTDSVDDAVLGRAAGVQLIYDGLRLTRTLAQEVPWTSGDKADGDLDVLVADILVARGFYLLARTEAADAAVSTVRAFGRDQTVRREAADPSLDANLERDVFELAAVAGTTAVGGSPSRKLREFTASLAADLPEGSLSLPDAVIDHLASLVTLDSPSGEGVRTSADH